MTEAELAKAVVAYLEDLRWDVYQEVEGLAGVADIVALQGPILWVVEVKRVLSFDVIAQAAAWIGRAHRVSVAVPSTVRYNRGRTFAAKVLEWQGVGYIPIDCRASVPAVSLARVTRGRLHRRAETKAWRDSLQPEHKTHGVAGSPGGARWTPFKRTCKLVTEAVAANPGIQLKALVDAVDHHYMTDASARGSITHWIRKGLIEDVETRRDGRHLSFYPESKE